MKYSRTSNSSKFIQSSSARRTWIEIAVQYVIKLAQKSSSARRTWIEMKLVRALLNMGFVVLRTEDVD